MTDAAAMTSQPPAVDVWEIARQWGGPAALAGLAGWIVRQWLAWRKTRAKEREEQRLQGKAIRYLLDADRHLLRMALGSGVVGGALLEQLARQKALIDSVRDEIWIHDGHRSERDLERQAEALGTWLTRTQAIQAKAKTERLNPPQQDMFADEDSAEGH